MAKQTSGLIVFEDIKGLKAKMSIQGVTDLQKVKDFAQQMSSRTRCKIIECSYHESETVDIGTAVAGAWDSVKFKGMIVLEDKKTGRTAQYQLPAPLESMFEHITKVGYLMTQLHGDSIADDFNTATGRTVVADQYRFNKGKVKGIELDAQV